MTALTNLTIETGGVLLALSLVISGMVLVAAAMFRYRTPRHGDQFLRNTVEQRYRAEQE